jgi:adenosylcobinamide-GDP ribazoletransferase
VAGIAAGVAIAALATGWWVGPLAAAAAAAAAVVAALALRKIGGITGDVVGAVEQVAECAVLVVITGLASRHSVWWR